MGLVDTQHPADSYLLQVVVSGDGDRPNMPKDGQPLSPEEIQVIRRWAP
jgi:hypothetical protein